LRAGANPKRQELTLPLCRIYYILLYPDYNGNKTNFPKKWRGDLLEENSKAVTYVESQSPPLAYSEVFKI